MWHFFSVADYLFGNNTLILHFQIVKKTMTTELPKDPFMLLSVVNMKLRDQYASLEDLCDDMNVSRKDLEEQLCAAGFEYSAEQRRFW